MPNIDERVVQMRFDNKQFEQGVAESLKTLEKLKNSLQLEEASKSLIHLDKTVSMMNFDHLEQSIDKVTNAFTPLGRIAINTFDRIADKAVDTGKKMVGMLTGFNDMLAGKAKYEMETRAVMTITNATGKSVKEVESVLSKLMRYTDETSYDFAQMASSIGKFTAVGIDLEMAEEAMEGIANWAAKSGADKAAANRAMYNISQAMGMGAMTTRDWISIENATMATKEFKETAIETAKAMGILQDAGEKGVGAIVTADKKGNLKETIVDYKTFRETLTEKWFTSDVLTETLRKYGDQTTQFGLDAYHAAQNALTFTEAIDAVKDAVSSGWMRTMQLVFGDLDEARVFWTNLATWMQELAGVFSNARNSMLESWHDLGGYKALIESITNVWHAFENVVLGVREAIQRVFPPLWAENVVKYTEKVRDATQSLREFFGIDKWGDVEHDVEELEDATERINNNLKIGDKGEEVEELVKALKKAGYGDNLAGDIYNQTVKAAIKNLQKDLHVNLTGEWDDATREATKASKIFETAVEYTVEERAQTDFLSKPMKRIQEIVEGVASALKIVLSILKGGFDIAKSFLTIFNPVIDLVARVGAMFGQMFENLANDIERGGIISEFVENITTVFEPLANAIATVTQFFHDFINMYAYALRETNRENTFGNFFMFLLNYLKKDTILSPIVSIVETIIGTISYAASTIFGIITNTISMIGEAIVNLLGLQTGGGEYENSGLIVFLNTIHSVAYIATQALSRFIDIARNVIGIAVSTIMSIGRPAIQTVLSFIVQFVYTVIDNLPEITALLGKLSPIILAIVIAIMNVRKVQGPIAGMRASLLSLIGVFGFFIAASNYDKIQNFFIGLLNQLKEFKTVKNISSLIKEKIIPGIKSIFELDSNKKLSIFERISAAITNISKLILKTAKKIGTDFITLFFPTEDQKNSENENTFLKRLQSRYGFIIDWLGGVVEDIKAIMDKIWNSLFNLEPVEGGNVPESLLGKAFEGIKNIFKSVAEAAQNLLDSGYITTIITGMFAAGLLNMGRGIRKFSENIEGTILALKGNTVKDTFGTAALKFAGAVAIISAAMFLLSKIEFEKDSDSIINGLEAFETVVMVMLGAIASLKLMNKYLNNGSTADKRKGLANGIFEFAVSIAAIGAGLLLIQKFLTNGEKVGETLGLLAGILVTLVAVQAIMLLITKKSGRRELSAATDGIFDLCKGVLAIAGAITLLSLISIINYRGVLRATKILIAVIAELGIIMGVMLALASKNPKGSVEASVKGITGICVGLLAIAGAIMILTATFAIGRSNADKAFWAIEGMLVTLGAITVLMTAIASKNKKGSVLASVSGIVAMCAGIIVIATAIGKVTSLIDKYGGSDVGGAVAIIAGILLALGAFSIILLEMSRGDDVDWKKLAASMIPLAGLVIGVIAIAEALADSLNKIKGINPDLVLKFLLGLSAVLVVVGTITIAVSKFKVDIGAALSAAVGLVAILAGIGVGVYLLAQLGSASIERGAQALWTLTSNITQVSYMLDRVDWENFNKMKVLIKDTLPPIIAKLIEMNLGGAIERGRMLVRLGGQISIFAGSISRIQGDIGTIKSKAIGIVETAEEVTSRLSSLTIPSIVHNAELISLGSELSIYSRSLSHIDISGLQAAIDTANNAKAVSDIISTIRISNNLNTTLAEFGSAIKLYYAAVAGAGLDENGNPIEINDDQEISPELLGRIMEGLAKSINIDTINQISSFAEGEEHDMTNVALGITAIGTALSTYAKDISGINVDDVNTANSVLDTISDVYTKLSDSNLKEDEEYVDELYKDNKLELFGKGIEALAGALGTYKDEIGGIKPDEVAAANSVLNTVKDLKQYLDSENTDTYVDIDGMNNSLPGKTTIEDFAAQLTALGTGISDYCTSTKDVEDKDITSANRVLSFVTGLQRTLPRVNGVIQLFTGVKDLGSFASGIGSLGQGIANFKRALIDPETKKPIEITANDTRALRSIKVIAEATGALGNTKILSSGNINWEAMGANLWMLPASLRKFQEETEKANFNPESVEATLEVINKITKFLGVAESSYTKFEGNMIDWVTGSIASLISYLSSQPLDTVDGQNALDVMNTLGDTLINTIATGIGTSILDDGYDPVTHELVRIISSAADELNKNHTGKFKSIGTNLIQGLADGIKEQLQTVIDASNEMGDSVLNEVTLKFDVHSPSKKFEWIAQMCALGLANGFDKYAYLVKDAAAATASGSIDTIMAALDSNKVRDIGRGALDAIQQLLFTGQKDKPYTEKEMNLIKQMLVGTGYLAEDSIEDIEKVKDAIVNFKKDVLYGSNSTDPITGDWGYEESLKLYQRVFESLYQNGNKGYTQLEYETEVMKKLGIESKSSTDQIIESNEQLADSIETVADMYATLNDEQKKIVEESVDPDWMTEALYWANVGDDLVKKYGEQTNPIYDYYQGNLGGINWDSDLNSYFNFGGSNILDQFSQGLEGFNLSNILGEGFDLSGIFSGLLDPNSDLLTQFKNTFTELFNGEGGIFSSIGTSLFGEGGLISEAKNKIVEMFNSEDGVIQLVGNKIKEFFGIDGEFAESIQSNPVDVPLNPVIDMSSMENNDLLPGLGGDVGVRLESTNLTADLSTESAQIINSGSQSQISELQALKQVLENSGNANKTVLDQIDSAITGIQSNMRNINVYIDGNRLVGYMGPKIDNYLGARSIQVGRLQL